MQFVLEPPQQMEVVEVEMQSRAIVITPVMLKGQHVVKSAYLTAKGVGGTESKAVVLFNANTGEFTIQRIDGDPVRFDFDLPKAEFAQKRQAIRRAGQLGGKARASKQEEGEDATAD